MKGFSISDCDEFQKTRRVPLRKLPFPALELLLLFFYLIFFNIHVFLTHLILILLGLLYLYASGTTGGTTGRARDLINKRNAFG